MSTIAAPRPAQRGRRHIAALIKQVDQHRGWTMAAIVLASAGIAGSVLGAAAVAREHAAQTRAAFTSRSQQIASNLQTAVLREEDLVATAGAYILGAPRASNADLRRWAGDARITARYPELIGLVKIVLVPASRLAAFAAHAKADPAGRSFGPHGRFVVVPAGARPYYCFPSLSLGTGAPAGNDLCAGDSALSVARDTGRGTIFPIAAGTLHGLGIETPVYQGGGVPGTVATRRRAFVGWIGIIVSPDVVLRAAAHGQSGIAVVLKRSVAGSTHAPVAFALGKIPTGASTVTVDLHDGSSVQTFAHLHGADVFATAASVGVLIGGGAISTLLAILLSVMATGRARALRLVGEKTGQLAFQAMHDPLTLLPNRALITDRATQLLGRARRRQSTVAAMFIDIDGFKHVNDTFGHAAGDELLQVIAARLTSVVRDSDTVGRLGGDEFVVLLDGDALGGPDLVAQRLLNVLRQPIELTHAKKWANGASASIGIAVGLRADAEEMLRDADLALYRAKAAGKDRYVLFEQSMQRADADRRALEIDLEHALERAELFLLYQPMFDLQTQRVTGVEALIRWRHPTRGIVTPDAFIPLAEETAMIVPIGRWVLDAACRQASLWTRAGRSLGMSVNVSALQLHRDEFADEVREVLEHSRIDPSTLTLEIAETVLMRDADAAAARLRELKALGVRIAVDDFGIGYSAVTSLRQFPLDAIKIDQSLISGTRGSEESAALMRTLIQLGKTLGLETLGEGIEEQAQLDRLRREDCASGQGFLFARPLDAEQVERFLMRDGPTAATAPLAE
jgi:diguanylate cyclase (GGDEF)-like protein